MAAADGSSGTNMPDGVISMGTGPDGAITITGVPVAAAIAAPS